MNKRKKAALSTVVFFTLISWLFFMYGRWIWHPYYLKIKGKRTVQEVVDHYGKPAESRLKAYFQEAKASYPPLKIALITFKDQKTLDLWATDTENNFTLIHTYKVKGASGVLGPKLLEGDRQVPEGIYKIEGLNPNSSYHLSMKLNYPNQFDLRYAKLEGRKNPGSNIFIHGKSVSIGCLAMGDRAIEDLFILSQKVGFKNIEVIIAPTNFIDNKNMAKLTTGKPSWVAKLYGEIQIKLLKYYGN